MSIHKPVLLKETIELLNLKEGNIVVDATLGGGGHSRSILERIGENGKLVAIDADLYAIDSFSKFLISNFQFPNKSKIRKSEYQTIGNVVLVNDNFRNLKNILAELRISSVDAILADLGWSSDQLEGKGMSFQKDEKLDMGLNEEQELTAEVVVNFYGQEKLDKLFSEYGEERYARNIARKISEARKTKPIETTFELVKVIGEAVPEKYKHKKIHFATRTFQAIRIEVNDELNILEQFIPQAIEALAKGGRLGIMSFHSQEDRIVKNIFRKNARGCIFTDEITGRKIVKEPPVVRIITKKPIVPSERETKMNPRSRSAKLRFLEKI